MFDTIRAMASPVNDEFVDKVPEDTRCTICTNILTNPILTECCGQLFCDGCLYTEAEKEDMPTLSKGQLQFYEKDLRMKRAIDSSKGCSIPNV